MAEFTFLHFTMEALMINFYSKNSIPLLLKYFNARTPHMGTIGALIVKTAKVNFSYFKISIAMGTLTHVLFNRQLRLFF